MVGISVKFTVTAHRLLIGLGAGFMALLWVKSASTQPIAVPVRLQAELLSKVAAYDRGFLARARGRVLVFVITKAGDPESDRVGEQIRAELRVLDQIGGLPHTEETIAYSSAGSLAELCQRRMPTIVYLSLGLGDQIESLANALDGQSVLSVAVAASYVPKRAVLGFDTESGKPKLLVHLGQARHQQVAFKPELLALARVTR